MSKRMEGKLALVTGGGGGIGEATGLLLAEEGAAVALVDVNGHAVDSSATRIAERLPGAAVLSIAADLTREREAQRAVDETVKRYGGLHALVNSAGVRVYGALADADPKSWEFIIAVNVLATANHALFDYVLGSEEERSRRPMSAPYRRRYKETNYPTLPELIVGAKPGRTRREQMTFHHNLSAGIQFAAVGYLVYRYARDNGLGKELPLEWFQQEIRN